MRLATEKASYNDITIEAIAREAHVAKATIYRWWKTKYDLVREACFEGRLRTPQTGSLKGDTRDLILQEAALHQGSVSRGVIAGFMAEFIERHPCTETGTIAPQRHLQVAVESVLNSARRRGDNLDSLDASTVTDLIEMTLYHRCIVRGQQFTAAMADSLLMLIFPPIRVT